MLGPLTTRRQGPVGKHLSPGPGSSFIPFIFSPRRARLLLPLLLQGGWAVWVLCCPYSPHPCPDLLWVGLVTVVSTAQPLCREHDLGQPV